MKIRNNIRSFPRNKDQRFYDASDFFEKGECDSALKEATELVNEGYGHANTLLGVFYEKGCDAIEPDYEKAKFYYQMAVDTTGSVEAWLALGRLHFLGKGMKPDYEKAFYYYSLVNEDTQNAVASLMLGRMYFDGKGVPKNIEEAKYHFSTAADLGSIFALSYLGIVAWEQRYIFRSFWYRFKAVALAMLATLRDSSRSKLRRI